MESGVQADLNAIEFFDSILGYCTGENGTLLKANSDGVSWSVVDIDTEADLNDICILQPDDAWIAGDQGVVLHSDDKGSSWQQLSLDSTTHFASVFFLDVSCGWVGGCDESGNGIVYSTVDGGETWTEISGGGLPAVSVLFYTSTTTGWAVMGGGDVYKTINGGFSWEFHLPDPQVSDAIRDIFFPDASHGWAVGVSYAVPIPKSIIYFTSDGGNTWEIQESNSWNGFNGAHFTDPDHGCCVGPYGSITCTPNGGDNWVVLSGAYVRPELYDVVFVDEQQGWAAGGSEYPLENVFLRTTDAGNTWEEVGDLDFCFHSIEMQDGVSGWGAGKKTIGTQLPAVVAKTIDGGLNWSVSLEVGVGASFKAVAFKDALVGWAVGEGSNSFPPDGGLFYQTTDAGESWEDLSPIYNQSLSSICVGDESYVWIAGNEVILATSDGGQSWNILCQDIHAFKKIFFINSDVGWVIGDSLAGSENVGVLMKTLNGGNSWEKEFFDFELKDIYFTTVDIGWLSGSSGRIFKTTDGGTTWWQEFSGTVETLHALHFTEAGQAFAVGGHSTILHSGEAGSVLYPEYSAEARELNLSVFPNPINDRMSIVFEMEEGSSATLVLYTLQGALVEVLFSEWVEPGVHFHDWACGHLASGVYELVLLTPVSRSAIKVVQLE